MLGNCNYIDENGVRCNKTYVLTMWFFNDPYSVKNNEFIHLCKWHNDSLELELIDRIREFQIRLSSLKAENSRLNKIARDNDSYINSTHQYQKISNMQETIKQIQNNECRNIFCRQNLRQLPREAKLYSVHTFTSSGRRRYTFYYCSLKCFNNIKAKCGIYVPLNSGQTVLT